MDGVLPAGLGGGGEALRRRRPRGAAGLTTPGCGGCTWSPSTTSPTSCRTPSTSTSTPRCFNVYFTKLEPAGQAGHDGPREHRRGEPLRRRHGDRLHLEADARHVHLHRVRALPRVLPDHPHPQAAAAGALPDDACATSSTASRSQLLGDPGSKRRHVPGRAGPGSDRPGGGVGLHHLPLVRARLPARHQLRRQARRACAATWCWRRPSFPDEAQAAFRGYEVNGNPWQLPAEQRADWAQGLDVPLAAEAGGDFEYLFFVGSPGSYDDDGKKIVAARWSRSSRRPASSFAILGPEEVSTGDAARRLGNEYLFQTLAQQNVDTLNGYGVKKIVTNCPHVLQHPEARVPRLRRALRGGPRHPAGRRAGALGPGQAHSTGSTSTWPTTTPATSAAPTASTTRRASCCGPSPACASARPSCAGSARCAAAPAAAGCGSRRSSGERINQTPLQPAQGQRHPRRRGRLPVLLRDAVRRPARARRGGGEDLRRARAGGAGDEDGVGVVSPPPARVGSGSEYGNGWEEAVALSAGRCRSAV